MKKTLLILTTIALFSIGFVSCGGEPEKQSELIDNAEDSVSVKIETAPVVVDTTTVK